ncbi:MAG: hypothetical protein WD226_06215 [Planctomycetota bacterium]
MSDPLFEPERTAATAPAGRVEFPCKRCGAKLRWDPAADALACDYCQARVPVPRREGTILERPLAAAGDAARGLGLDYRAVRCQECGATIELEETQTATVCAYCGSPSVLVQAANRNALRPESVLPLNVGADHVRAAFQKWVKGLWFRPNALKNTKRFDAIGLYAPFWTYDCAVHSEWSAQAGYYYYETRTVTVMVNGRPTQRTQQVRKVRWVPAWGERDDAFDDVLVCGSRGLSVDLLAKLGDYDLTELVPYRPEYLAGWRAEEYSIDLEGGWERAEQYVERVQRERCSGDVPGDTQRNLRVENRVRDVRWKHLLLPLWSLQYRFGGKTYTVLVNGQTGSIVGKAPLSPLKISLFVLFLAALVAVIVLLIQNA